MSRPAGLPQVRSVLAVCAHPDDESFGLGAVISAFVETGTPVAVLSFTHGEASTLGGVNGDLRSRRALELVGAGRQLGVWRTELLDYPDGALPAQPTAELSAHVQRAATSAGADALLVFDAGGITGHPDHVAATKAALAAAEARDLDVLAWALPDSVAERLNEEFGTAFVGRDDAQLALVAPVDRTAQHAALAEHASQSRDNPVLWRRLELLGDTETIRWLRRSAPPAPAVPGTSTAVRAAR